MTVAKKRSVKKVTAVAPQAKTVTAKPAKMKLVDAKIHKKVQTAEGWKRDMLKKQAITKKVK